MKLPPTPPSFRGPQAQAGLTLIELMVGVFLGLLTVAVALGSLLVSRGFTASTVDSSQLQQQAAYAMRIFAQQIRQAGSLQLQMDMSGGASIDYNAPVGFLVGYGNYQQIVHGTGNSSITVGHENYYETNVEDVANGRGAGDRNSRTLFRDCLGQGGGFGAGGALEAPILTSTFAHNATDQTLECTGATGRRQPIISNVSDFQVRYFVQENPTSGDPTIRRLDTAQVSSLADGWSKVVAVELCLDMVGDVRTDLPATSQYTNCSEQQAGYGGRQHLVYRNVFQVRSQGIVS